MFKWGLLWGKIYDSDSSSKRGISETKFDIFFSWFSIWFNSLLNFELLNFIWSLYDDVADDVRDDAIHDASDEFVNLIILYEEFSKLYAKLLDVDVKLSWDLRDLEELVLLNFLIILLIVTKNNHKLLYEYYIINLFSMKLLYIYI